MTTTTATTTVQDDVVVETLSTPTLTVQRNRKGGKGLLRQAGPPAGLLLAIVVIWYAVSLSLGNLASGILPLPHTIFTEAFFDPTVSADILSGLLQTIATSLTGLAVAIVIGVAWAVAMVQAKVAERTLYPYAVILQCIPILALVPLIGFWFGQDFPARVIVSVLIALFPMVSNTLFGMQSVDRLQKELFKLQGASRWTVLTKLQFPTALPAMFAGMRISAGLSVVGAIVGDFFFQQGVAGLGTKLSYYTSTLAGPALFACILTAALLGVVIFAVFGWIAQLAVGKWYQPAG